MGGLGRICRPHVVVRSGASMEATCRTRIIVGPVDHSSVRRLLEQHTPMPIMKNTDDNSPTAGTRVSMVPDSAEAARAASRPSSGLGVVSHGSGPQWAGHDPRRRPPRTPSHRPVRVVGPREINSPDEDARGDSTALPAHSGPLGPS